MLRRYWWVNQTTNYDPEILEGRLWTSPNRHGTLIAGRKAILEMTPGDLVFHYNRGRIRALSMVATSAIETPRPVTYPAQSPLGPDDGWAVYLDAIRSDLSVPGGEVRTVLPHGTDTVDRIGVVNRRYLSELPERDASALASLAGIDLPVEDSFAGRPWAEVIDPDTKTDGLHWATFRREQAYLRASLASWVEARRDRARFVEPHFLVNCSLRRISNRGACVQRRSVGTTNQSRCFSAHSDVTSCLSGVTS